MVNPVFVLIRSYTLIGVTRSSCHNRTLVEWQLYTFASFVFYSGQNNLIWLYCRPRHFLVGLNWDFHWFWMRSSERTAYSRVLLHSHQYTLIILSKLQNIALFNSFELLSYCIFGKTDSNDTFWAWSTKEFPAKTRQPIRGRRLCAGTLPANESSDWVEGVFSFIWIRLKGLGWRES